MKIFLRKKKKKSDNMVVDVTKFFQKIKKLIKYRKKYCKMRKNVLL